MRKLLMLFALLSPVSVSAQAHTQCVSSMRRYVTEQAAQVDAIACTQLASVLRDSVQGGALLDSLNARLVPSRELQSKMSETSGATGTAAAVSAVPSVRPVGLASGSLAVVGTEGGTGAISSLSVNPLVSFLLADGAGRANEALAKYSRFLDVSAFFPAKDPDANADGKLDYFGFRLRLNWTGLSAGDSVWSAADRELGRVVSSEVSIEAGIEDALLALDTAEQVEACARAILGQRLTEIEVACGSSIDLEMDAAAYGRLSRALAAVRDKADSEYWGFDIRMDYGDPTLGDVPGASGASYFIGAALGRRIGTGENLSPLGYRARAGLRFASLDQPDTTHVAFEGGAALELSRTYNGRQLSLSGGIEMRYGGETALASELRTNYLVWRAALSVPFTEEHSIAISVSRPISGRSHITPTFSIGADWGLLFPGAAGGGQAGF